MIHNIKLVGGGNLQSIYSIVKYDKLTNIPQHKIQKVEMTIKQNINQH